MSWRIWRFNTISFASKFKLYKSLVTSILIYGCETWTLLADSEKGSKLSKPSTWGTFSVSPTWSTKTNDCAEQDQLPCGFLATFSGNFQETETCMIRAYHTPRQPLQSHPSRHFEGWTTPWSAEEMLDGQLAHKGLLQKRLEENPCWIVRHVPPTTQSVDGLNWTELNWISWSIAIIWCSSKWCLLCKFTHITSVNTLLSPPPF